MLLGMGAQCTVRFARVYDPRMIPERARRVSLAWAAGALACSCSSQPSGTLLLVTPDGETDTFMRAPTPAVLRVDEVDPSGTTRTLATAQLPVSSMDLGSLDPSSVETLTVTGLDDGGARVLFGESIPLELGALDGATLPIFVQRTGELALLPKPLADARRAPTLAVWGRYLFVGGGADASLALNMQLYDFAALAPVASLPGLPRDPKSIAFVGSVAWLIDDSDGQATEYDLASNTWQTVSPPAGGAFADVAGGGTVVATDGTQYVVGATRTTGSKTATVLVFGSSGQPSWASLSAPRLGAAAAWVDGRGLVVAGGSATAAGVEVLAPGASAGTALQYAPDPSAGAGASVLPNQHVLLAGGTTPAGQDATVREIDP